MNHPYRRLPLQNMYNFRDIGGYPAEGGVTRYGKFYRSDLPGELPLKDIEAILAANVRTVIDFRSDREVENHPHALRDVAEIDYHRVSLFGDNAQLKEQMGVDPETSLLSDLGRLYIGFADFRFEQIVQVFNLLVQAMQKGAVLVNCSAGKDRTGVISALVLLLCGVPKWDIVADYAITQILLEPKIRHMVDELNMEVPAAHYISPPENMERFVDHIAQKFGSAEAYLIGHGFDRTFVDTLIDQMVERV